MNVYASSLHRHDQNAAPAPDPTPSSRVMKVTRPNSTGRAKQACQQCRTIRRRCEPKPGGCKQCEERGWNCVFSPVSRRRRRRKCDRGILYDPISISSLLDDPLMTIDTDQKWGVNTEVVQESLEAGEVHTAMKDTGIEQLEGFTESSWRVLPTEPVSLLLLAPNTSLQIVASSSSLVNGGNHQRGDLSIEALDLPLGHNDHPTSATYLHSELAGWALDPEAGYRNGCSAIMQPQLTRSIPWIEYENIASWNNGLVSAAAADMSPLSDELPNENFPYLDFGLGGVEDEVQTMNFHLGNLPEAGTAWELW